MKKRSLLIILLAAVMALGLAACGENNPTALAVSGDPAKMEYTIGEALDLSGGELKVTYKDGTTATVSMTDDKVKAEGFDSSTAGSKSVTLTYLGLTASITVKVEARITSIEVLTNPTTTEYFEGEALSLTGGQLKVNYNNNTSQTVSMTAAGVTSEGYDNAVLGQQTVTVKYAGFETNFKVTVKPAAQSIELEDMPQTVNYKPGSQLDLTGGKIKVTFTDGTSANIDMTASGVTVTGFNSIAPGEQTIIIRYMGKETQFKVKVLSVTAIVVSEDPSKEEYSLGQTLNLSGGMLEVTYEDTSSDFIAMTSLGVTTEGFSSESAGPCIITVKYYGQTATFAVNIALGDMIENLIELVERCEWAVTNTDSLSGSNTWDQNPNDLFFEMYFFSMYDAVVEVLDSGNTAVIAYFESELEARCNTLLNEFNEYYFYGSIHNDAQYIAFIEDLLHLYYRHYQDPLYTLGDEDFDTEFSRLWEEFLGLPGLVQEYVRNTWNNRAFHFLSYEYFEEMDMWEKLYDVWGFYIKYLKGMNPGESFIQNMEWCISYYESLSGEMKEKVDRLFGYEYGIYLDAYNKFTEVPEEIWDINDRFQIVYQSYADSVSIEDYTLYIVAYTKFVSEMEQVLAGSSEKVLEYYNNFPIGGNSLAKWYSNLGEIYDEISGTFKGTPFFDKYIEVATKWLDNEEYVGGNAEFDSDAAELFGLLEGYDDEAQLRFFLLFETAYSSMIDSYYMNLFKDDYYAYQTYVRLHFAWTFDLMTRNGADLLIDVLLSSHAAIEMYAQIEDTTLFDLHCSARYNKYLQKFDDENFIHPVIFEIITNMIDLENMQYLSENLKDYTYFMISYYKMLDTVEKLYETKDDIAIEIYEDRYLFSYGGANLMDFVAGFESSYLRAVAPFHEPNSDEEVSKADVETYAAYLAKYLLAAENYIYDESYVVGESNVDAAITALIEEFRTLKPLMQLMFKNRFGGVYGIMVEDYYKYYLGDDAFKVYSYLYSAVHYYSFYMADAMDDTNFLNFMSRAIIGYNNLGDTTLFDRYAGAEYQFYLAEFDSLKQYSDRIYYIMLFINSESSVHGMLTLDDYAMFLYHYEGLTAIINEMIADNIAEEIADYENILLDGYGEERTLKEWYEYYSGPECYGKLQNLISTHFTSAGIFEEFFGLYKKFAFDLYFHPDDFYNAPKEDMSRLIALFMQLTKAEQNSFTNYIASETFYPMLGEYYSMISGRFTAEEATIFRLLRTAVQNYNSDYTEGFMDNMEQAVSQYEALEDKSNFDAHVAAFFNHYRAIYESMLEEEPEDPENSESATAHIAGIVKELLQHKLH